MAANVLTRGTSLLTQPRKFGTKVNFDGYRVWREQRQGDSTNSATISPSQVHDEAPPISAEVEGALDGPHGSAPTPASFAEICQLIADGKPIPGIRDIPDTVLEGQATSSQATRRKKPWEKETSTGSLIDLA